MDQAGTLVERREFASAENWLIVLMIAWPLSLVGDGWWKAPAWLASALSFAALSQSKLPLARTTRVAFAWCMCFALGSATLELWSPGTLPTASLHVAKVLVFGWIVVLMSGILAFGTAMQGLARVAGSRASLAQWQSVLAWQLGLFCVGVLVFSIHGPGSYYAMDSGFMFVLVMLLVLVAIGVVIHPIVALNQLRLRLQECRRRQG